MPLTLSLGQGSHQSKSSVKSGGRTGTVVSPEQSSGGFCLMMIICREDSSEASKRCRYYNPYRYTCAAAQSCAQSERSQDRIRLDRMHMVPVVLHTHMYKCICKRTTIVSTTFKLAASMPVRSRRVHGLNLPELHAHVQLHPCCSRGVATAMHPYPYGTADLTAY